MKLSTLSDFKRVNIFGNTDRYRGTEQNNIFESASIKDAETKETNHYERIKS